MPPDTNRENNSTQSEENIEDVYVCNGCEEERSREDDGESLTRHGECICDECRDENYYSCNDCCELEHIHDSYLGPDDCYYCENCRDNSFSYCESCDVAEWHDEMRWVESTSMYLCDSCYEEECCDPHNHIENAPSSVSVTHHRTEDTSKLDVKRLVGIESEVTIYNPETDNDGYAVAYYRHNIPKSWREVHDGSIEGDYGRELISSPANGNILDARIRELTQWAHTYRATPNRSCGLHIHIDATDTDWNDLRWIALVMKKLEYNIFDMLPPSRRGSNWCKKVEMSFEDLRDCTDGERFVEMYYDGYGISNEKYNDSRYHGLNLHSRYYLGTIEFRYHSGTTNYEKIYNWIRLCNSVVETGIYIARCKDSTDKKYKKLVQFYTEHTDYNMEKSTWNQILDNMIGVDDKLRRYIFTRIQKFTPESPDLRETRTKNILKEI